MNSFQLLLISPAQSTTVDGVTSFVGRDESGSFGLCAGHCRFMTMLCFGLARYRVGDELWQYVALPGGLLYFSNTQLSICTRRYLVDRDRQRVSEHLDAALRREEQELKAQRQSVHELEQAMLRRLWYLRRQ